MDENDAGPIFEYKVEQVHAFLGVLVSIKKTDMDLLSRES